MVIHIDLAQGVMATSFFLFLNFVVSLARPTCSSLMSIVNLCGTHLASILPILYFSTLYQDTAGKILAYGLVLFITGYACLGGSFMPKEP